MNTTSAAATVEPTRQGLDALSWPHAELRLGGPAGVAHRDALVCIARGRPDFGDTGAAGSDDAERWLDLFAQHGEAAPERVRGRFGLAIVDTARRTVFAATDRFATESWCHATRNGRLLLSDRADLIGDGARVAPEAIYSYLFHHVIPAPLTIFEDVARLEGGHRLRWADGEVAVAPWWRPAFREPDRIDFAEARERFLELVRQAVARAAGRGRVGSFLSGGTDSSTVAGMLCQVGGAPAETYSIGFDASGYDEMEYARIASRHFGTHHHEYYVTPEDLLEGIPLVARHYDQPFGNSSAVPAWLCARLAAGDGIETLLAGDGGDELFGGNARYAKQRVFGWYDHLPEPLRGGLLERLLDQPSVARLPLFSKAASYARQARIGLPGRLHQYNLVVMLGADQILEPDFLHTVDLQAPHYAHEEVWSRIDANDDLNRMLAFDMKFTLADNDLPKVLGTTAMAGLGVEFPLLDDALLDFSLGLPCSYKLKGFRLRWFFKEALRDFLPAEIITKKKHGFGLPFGVWACQHAGLRSLAGDTLASFRQRGIVQPAFVDRLLNELLPAHPGYYGELVWILLMLELWLEGH